MGLVVMSERELKRLEVLGQVEAGTLTVEHAGHVVGISERHAFRLVAKLRRDGAASMGHAARGKHSNNRKPDRIKEYAIGLVKERYDDFGPTLAAEMPEKRLRRAGRQTGTEARHFDTGAKER